MDSFFLAVVSRNARGKKSENGGHGRHALPKLLARAGESRGQSYPGMMLGLPLRTESTDGIAGAEYFMFPVDDT